MNGLYDEVRLALHGIWTRRWIALAVAWGIALLGWFAVSQIPNTYESRARVFVQLSNVLPDAVGINPQMAQKNVDTVRQTLVSAVNLEKVVRGTDLANTVATPADLAARVAGLSQAIKITPQQDNLFEITAKAPSPKIASAVVQKLIDIFVETNLAGDRSQTSQSLRFLDAQLSQRQKQLQEAEAKRTDFQNRYLGSLPGTGSLTDRMGAARQQMSQVDGDLAAAQSSLAAINGQMAGTATTVAGPGGTGATGPARARLSAIQGQIADARARGFTDQHPDMMALRSQLAQATAAARAEPVGTVGAGASANPLYLSLKSMQADKQAQVAALQMRKAQLQGDLDQISGKLAGDPAVAAEQGQIERDYQVLKDQYDKLLADREEIAVRGQAQTQTDAVKFNVVDPPTRPTVPAAPNRTLLLTGVLIAAIGGGIGAAFALGQLQTTFATSAKLEKTTGLPVIGTVREMVGKAEIAARRRRLLYFAGGGGALAVAYVALLGVEMIQRGLAA
ncbi:XrtA system polysaccharide chain length determinant [Sphingomonas aracearum]|uniref:Chain-length determining protein n=1 Tax=Sphingomonas aracearum TaxID=2283317 RepID=A0A369VZN1_9SPHN|nr:XrtA system polysaccharide chain length determinant [Sphingomonas aracearum]RDE06580.1 chain-length determining protein [Sphingomonas aracearum]